MSLSFSPLTHCIRVHLLALARRNIPPSLGSGIADFDMQRRTALPKFAILALKPQRLSSIYQESPELSIVVHNAKVMERIL